MNKPDFYPIGTTGKPWGESEIEQWRSRQVRTRHYDRDVLPRIDALVDRYDKVAYGNLDYAGESYTLFALRNRQFDAALPTALVTGGVHGYETSGVLGALSFMEKCAPNFDGKLNLVVVPCVSPWGYERISRWNYDAVDPNRNFRPDGPAREATALIDLVRAVQGTFLVHVDLHETTNSDASEFGPARAARDGKDYELEIIPDGFYVVADDENPQLLFQKSIIAAVEQVTHIAPADEKGEILGSTIISRGIIEYPLRALALCTSVTGARYTTTTEVYPDSSLTTPEECILAQVTAVRAALDFALTQA
jgi:Succinylglutamate desuccinylase / Aspartoacylase family